MIIIIKPVVCFLSSHPELNIWIHPSRAESCDLTSQIRSRWQHLNILYKRLKDCYARCSAFKRRMIEVRLNIHLDRLRDFQRLFRRNPDLSVSEELLDEVSDVPTCYGDVLYTAPDDVTLCLESREYLFIYSFPVCCLGPTGAAWLEPPIFWSVFQYSKKDCLRLRMWLNRNVKYFSNET